MSPPATMLVMVFAVLALASPLASARVLNSGAAAVTARRLSACQADCSSIMGSAANFGVLAYSTITSMNDTLITGDLGLYPGSGVVGFPPGNYTGTLYISDAVAVAAKHDAQVGFNTLVSTVYNASDDFTGRPLANMTLTAGKYFYASAAVLDGNLTFDAQGNAGAIFIIQTGSTLEFATDSQVILANGAQACNIFYAVGSSATILAGSYIAGTVVAYQSVGVSYGAVIDGTLCGLGAAVTLISNTITAQGAC